ncbi:uncharacterized protein LOC113547814 [Rhopalosiphum maidis]|uniref:uncharacterized protein LOC113547814 n=1 Tax=Rhopalosiphum maidis TaxID=43146 RepID=UPI000F00D0CB|nr:uncharacterized protein LOC113547814 [Rhopalosiphum maidis]
MSDEDPLSINALPDEILLYVFRTLSATEFVATLPLVCERWSRIIASDSCTLKRIGMHHANAIAAVEFFYFRDESERSQMFHWPSDDYGRLLRMTTAQCTGHDYRGGAARRVGYANAFYLCARYEDICGHVAALVISSNLSVYATDGFTFVDRLTTLVLHGVRIREADQYTLAELGTVYVNVLDVVYVKCSLALRFDLKFLHAGFEQLRRFRVDHNAVGVRFLDDLLHTHRHTLETVVLSDCTVTGDRWIDVLSDRLRGRTVNRLSMHSAYFTDRCVNQFLNSADLVLPDDRSNVIIDSDLSRISFSINIDPL